MQEQNINLQNQAFPFANAAIANELAQLNGSQGIINEQEEIIAKLKIEEFVKEKREFYNSLMTFLENSDDTDDDFNYFNHIFDIQKYGKNHEKMEDFLLLIHYISNNHHRDRSFIKNIYKIIQFYENIIKQTFSNIEIFEIFKNNKMILLFLIQNKIITIDDNICHKIIDYREMNCFGYCHFFYPEIKKLVDEEKRKCIELDLLKYDQDVFYHFDEKRQVGENESYICSLIQNDSVEEFIAYVNRSGFSLKSEIKPSIFETNQILKDNKTTLIEYSAFFGSIQIFQYLRMNGVKLTPSLWLYAIHSRNAELIHLLESNGVKPDKDYEDYFCESIKCHHNEIANYIADNYNIGIYKNKENEKIISAILHYRNYNYFPSNFSNNYEFFYLCNFHYSQLKKLFLQMKSKYINKIAKDMPLIQQYTVINDIIAFYLLLQDHPNIKFNIKIDNAESIYQKLTGIQSLLDDVLQLYLDTVNLKRSSVSYENNTYTNNIYSNNDCLLINCSSLTHVVVPSSMESIGDHVFNKFYSLEHIVIGSSVQSICDYAFNDCKSLKKIVLPSCLKLIGKFAFNKCESLTQIIIPSSVQSIGDLAFNKCTSLKHVVIHSSVKAIGDFAFNDCSALTQIVIPSSVKSIGQCAFQNCTSLTQIEIPSSVNSFGEYMLSGIKNIEIKGNIKSIPKYLFIEKSLRLPNKYQLINGSSQLTQIIIPSFVISINSYAFICSKITHIIIPPSVISLGDYTFYGCTSLLQIDLPSVISIGDNNFQGCTSLTKVSFSSSIISIGNNNFCNCSSLTEIVIPSSNANFGKNNFESVISLEIMGNIKCIPKKLFKNCSSLKKIKIPPSVISIGDSAFKFCTQLEQIVIPPSVKIIHNNAFYGCKSLRKIDIPSSVISIGKGTFYGCQLFSKANIPPSVVSIDESVFSEQTFQRSLFFD